MSRRILGLSVFVIAFSISMLSAKPADADWIGTTPVTGTIQRISAQNFHGHWHIQVTLSAPFARCNSTTTAVIQYRMNNVVMDAHEPMLRIAMAAKLAGRSVKIWHDLQTFNIFGSNQSYCVIQQIELQ